MTVTIVDAARPVTGGVDTHLDLNVAAGRACGAAKSRDGNVEAIRALVVAKRSARSAKIQTLNQIRHLSFTAPDQLRERLAGVSRHHLAARAAALRPGQREGADPVIVATKTALRILGRRVLALDEEKARIDALLSTLVTQTAPQLLAVFGVGAGTAAGVPNRIRQIAGLSARA
jgi:transposase